MMDRRHSQYLASGRTPLPRLRLFRTAELNGVGWSALALLCLAGAGVGYAAARLAGWRGEAAGVVGAVVCLIAVVIVDRRRWGRMETSFSWGNDPQAVVRVGLVLQRQGLSVRLETDEFGWSSLRYQNRNARLVRRALARAGVALPRW